MCTTCIFLGKKSMDIKNERVPENVECVGAYAETIAHICALMSFWFAFYYIFLPSFSLLLLNYLFKKCLHYASQEALILLFEA